MKFVKKFLLLFVSALGFSQCSTDFQNTRDSHSLRGRWRLVKMECRNSSDNGLSLSIVSKELSQLNQAISSKKLFSMISVSGRTIEFEQKHIIEQATSTMGNLANNASTDTSAQGSSEFYCEFKKVAKLSEDPRASFEIASEKIKFSNKKPQTDHQTCPKAEALISPRSIPFRLEKDGELRTYRSSAPDSLCEKSMQLVSIFERVL